MAIKSSIGEVASTPSNLFQQLSLAMIPAKAALDISTLFGAVMSLMFLYSPHQALTKYEIYVPPTATGRRAPEEPTLLEFGALYYFVILMALAVFSQTATVSAVRRIGHANTMKLVCGATAIGRGFVLAYILSQPLTDPMKKQLVVSGLLFVVQILGATNGGLPKLPALKLPSSNSGKASLFTGCLALLQVTVVLASDPPAYMAKMGLDVAHPQAKAAFATITNMWCLMMAASALTRVVAVLSGDKDTIYAVNRSTIFYYAMIVGVMAMFKAVMGAASGATAGANAQFVVLVVYFVISVGGCVSDDEAGYAKDEKKK